MKNSSGQGEKADGLKELFANDPMDLGDTFFFERHLANKGFCQVAGVDEAGRGPLAGPVVAGAVVLPPDADFARFKDSKKLTAKARERLFCVLTEMKIPIGVGIVSPGVIDQINILQASLKAMALAVTDLTLKPDFLLVDGKFKTPLAICQQPLVKGEQKSASIAAASIIAKVTRDKLMAEIDKQFPQYNFVKHKGYPTKEHKAMVARYGPSPVHRLTFKGVREHV